MAQEPETFTIDELHLVRVPSGRCPTCGRPSNATEAKAFKELRDQAADANGKRERLEADANRLREERDQLKVRNADLRAENKELKTSG